MVAAALLLALATTAVHLWFLEESRPPTEAEIRAALLEATPPGRLDAETRRALAEDDVALAGQLISIGDQLGRPVSDETRALLAEATGPVATGWRNARDFIAAFATGEADTTAGLAGAVVSDLTVVGDVRDLATEGGRAVVGEPYSEVLLAIAVAGLAAEGAVIATGGTSLVGKVALSTLKAAARSGHLTAAFTARLLRLARAAGGIAPAAARGTARAGDTAADVVTPAARAAARAELGVVARNLDTVRRNAGLGETVRLMRHVETTDDLAGLARFTGRFGDRARAVALLTGRAALRGFRGALRIGQVVVSAIASFAIWLVWIVGIACVRGAYAGTMICTERCLAAPFALARHMAARRPAGPPATA